jgi:flagellar biosynthetic protein FliP
VLSLLRQAIGTQTLPPSQVLVGLSLFMTFLVMAPTIKQIHERGHPADERRSRSTSSPRGTVPSSPCVISCSRRSIAPVTGKMSTWCSTIAASIRRSRIRLRRADVDMITLIPAYVLSELKTAFLIGFRIYLPFLIIDMVIVEFAADLAWACSCCPRCLSRCRSNCCCSSWSTDGGWWWATCLDSFAVVPATGLG